MSGTPEHWGQHGRAYREAWAKAGRPAGTADVAVAVHGFVGENDFVARQTYLKYELTVLQTGSAEIWRPMRVPSDRNIELLHGMVFTGAPEQIANRIIHLHKLLRHSPQIFQMDVGGLPHKTFMKSIELLGTQMLPRVREALAG